MYRRRRRNRGTWLPIEPTLFGAGETLTAASFHQEQFDAPVTNGEITPPISVPVAFDRTFDDDLTTGQSVQTMRDLTEGQDYYLDRIVGKIWGECGINDDDPIETLLCAAFAILPVSDNQPGAPALSNDSRNPLLSQNVMEPWIWRRTWKLYNGSVEAQGQAGSIFAIGPATISQYGSVMDGGHVDAKTRRRIRHNERLFFVASAACLFQNGGVPSPNGITIGFDVRLHGGLRRHRNKSSFQ